MNGKAAHEKAQNGFNEHEIVSQFQERFTIFSKDEKNFENITKNHTIVTEKRVPKVGVMLVGLGGNNGSTFVAGILANKRNVEFETKQGTQKPNFYGSFTQSATTHIGFKYDEADGLLKDVFKPINEILPMAHPCDFEVSGWDISDKNLYEACKRAKVLEPDLIKKLKSELEQIKPLKAALNGDFIASNQSDRADNCFSGTNKEIVERLRADIREMKGRTDKVIVLWSANTEQFLLPEIKDTDELKSMMERNI